MQPIKLISGETEQIQQFRALPWQLHRTYKTPLEDLNKFVATSLASFNLTSGVVYAEQVVFEPEHILQLFAKYSVGLADCYHFTVEAKGRHINELLEATLSDWIDFVFVGMPEEMAIYGDHDEYTTFYVRSQPTLDNLVQQLSLAGFEPVLDYHRVR